MRARARARCVPQLPLLAPPPSTRPPLPWPRADLRQLQALDASLQRVVRASVRAGADAAALRRYAEWDTALLAPAGALGCAYLIYKLPPATWSRLWIWMGLGLIVYFAYAYWHSRYHEKKVATVSGG